MSVDKLGVMTRIHPDNLRSALIELDLVKTIDGKVYLATDPAVLTYLATIPAHHPPFG